MYTEEKTIPFKLTPADLENLRLIRRRMNSFDSLREGEVEDEMSGDSSARKSDLELANQQTSKKSS